MVQHGLDATLATRMDAFNGHLDHGHHIPKDTLVEIHISTFTLLKRLPAHKMNDLPSTTRLFNAAI